MGPFAPHPRIEILTYVETVYLRCGLMLCASVCHECKPHLTFVRAVMRASLVDAEKVVVQF